jgi:hypothetical protein
VIAMYDKTIMAQIISKKPARITKKWIDKTSAFLDEKRMRDPKGNFMIVSASLFKKINIFIFKYAANKGIIIFPDLKGSYKEYDLKTSHMHPGGRAD